MAHLIKLNVLDMQHDNSKTYIPTLVNLDSVITIESSHVHSILNMKWGTSGLKVKETIEEILKMSKDEQV